MTFVFFCRSVMLIVTVEQIKIHFGG